MVHIQNAYAERDDRGAAMAEYGLLLVFIGLVSVAILATFGSTIRATFALGNEALDKSPALASGN